MPPIIAIFVCKTILLAAPDPMTRWENRLWDTTDAVMHCRRMEVQMTDPAVDQGQGDPQPFNEQRCINSGAMLGPNWDSAHKSSNYRFWKFACPVRIVDGNGKTIDWKIPECPSSDGTVVCEVDSQI